MEFLVSGILLLLYIIVTFKKTHILQLSIIFSFMWAFSDIMVFIGKMGTFGSDVYSRMDFVYMDDYIIWFTIISIIGFELAHLINIKKGVKCEFTITSLAVLLRKYKYVMYINFIIGIIRISIMISLYGFDSLYDFRQAVVFSRLGGLAAIVVQVSNLILLIANCYVAVLGLYHGLYKVYLNETIIIFILFAPVQMSTGGRLWILYFVLYYFGALLLGRSVKKKNKYSLFRRSERVQLSILFVIILSLVGVVGTLKSEEGYNHETSSFFRKFMYITDGTAVADYTMSCFPNHDHYGYGVNSLTQKPTTEKMQFYANKRDTIYGPMVNSILPFLYLDFGFNGSLVVWLIMAFLIELLGMYCTQRLTIISFFLYINFAKIMYETPLFESFVLNYPFLELTLLFYIFRKFLFSQYGVK